MYDNEDIILEAVDTTVNGSTTTETITYVHGPGVDEPLTMQKGGVNYYYHADALGSITELTDSGQTVVESYRYTSFGVTTKFGNTVNNSFRFTGREFDSEIGVYYYRARYYDPNIGRFISKDPIGIAGGVNLYNYVQGNPVNYTDPYGLAPISAIKQVLKKIHDLMGGSLPKGKPGKFGSPQRGTSEKGYRLDPPHPNAKPGSPESYEHINWWDYTEGKRKSGSGHKGVEPILGGILGFLGNLLDPFDAIGGELADNEDELLYGQGNGLCE